MTKRLSFEESYRISAERILGETERCAVYLFEALDTDDLHQRCFVQPRVLKKARTPEKNSLAKLPGEFQILEALQSKYSSRWGDAQAATIPRAVALGQIDGCDAIVMTFVPGRSLEDLVTQRVAHPVPEWLVALTLQRCLQTLVVVHERLGRGAPDLKRNSIRVGRATVGIIDWNVLDERTSTSDQRDRRAAARYVSELLTGRYTDNEQAIEEVWREWRQSPTELRTLLLDVAHSRDSLETLEMRANQLAVKRKPSGGDTSNRPFTMQDRLSELVDQTGWLRTPVPSAPSILPPEAVAWFEEPKSE